MPFNTSTNLLPFSGLYTALITPFKDHGASIDDAGFLHLLDRQRSAQVDGVVLLGTTGESATLTHAEENHLISLAANHVNGTLPLLVGIHCASTQAASQRAVEAEALGANGLLVLSPPYIRPTQEGLIQHFSAILRATSLPVILYNVPHRTGCHIELDTLKKLMHFPNLMGLKECSGNLSHITSCTHYMREHHPHFSMMSGDDVCLLPFMALGAQGLISVASNLFPRTLKHLVSLCIQEDFHSARILHNKLVPLFQALFFETNPIPIKEAMEFLKLPSGGCRLPLSPMQAANRQQLHTVLNHTLTLFKSFEDA